MGRLITLAVASLRQHVLDWINNAERIAVSIERARDAGAMLLVTPELAVTGYGLLDHFLESDVFLHSWEMLARIIVDERCQDIVCDVGMPVRHRNVRYNCRVIFYNKKIILIRPKQYLANDGNYRENRYFTPWMKERCIEDYYLESVVADITGQDKVPFGDAIVSTLDTCFAAETCEELFTPNAPHIHSGLDGCEIFTNSSGSHFELRKLMTRLNLIVEATRLSKGIYLYSNVVGCDGDRLYYDGSALIIVNGRVLAQGDQFSMDDVSIISATVDIEEVRSARSAPSRGYQAQLQPIYPRLDVNVRLSEPKRGPSPVDLGPTPERSIKALPAAEEIAYVAPLWLWDYLRKSGAAGFWVPLSGGIDSCATSVIVFSMCRLLHSAIHSPNTQNDTREQLVKDCRRICQPEKQDWLPSSPQDICNRIFVTGYLGTVNSSDETRGRAKDLAKAIGSYHIDLNIDAIVSAMTTVFKAATGGFVPKFRMHGGSNAENLALQNIQARIRMVISYLFAQLICTVRQRRGGGGLLVLGSANVDESLRGYYTKYDCSASDINPIGGISKTDLKSFIAYAEEAFDLPVLADFLDAVPTAELEPFDESYRQSDEVDMGMSYSELSVFGRLRKVFKHGPWGMYEHLVHAWGRPPPEQPSEDGSMGNKAVHESSETAHAIHGRGLTPGEVAEKVKRFYHFHYINRHKQTILPPSLHIESYSPDDNRFDLRPFLYPPMPGSWPVQKIDEHVETMEKREKEKASAQETRQTK